MRKQVSMKKLIGLTSAKIWFSYVKQTIRTIA